MDELRDVQETHKNLKWNLMACFIALLLFLGVMIGAVVIVLVVTKDVQVSDNGAMTAPIKDSDPKQKAIIETTPTRQDGGIGQLLEYDDSTDQWLVADQQLRNIDQVSF